MDYSLKEEESELGFHRLSHTRNDSNLCFASLEVSSFQFLCVIAHMHFAAKAELHAFKAKRYLSKCDAETHTEGPKLIKRPSIVHAPFNTTVQPSQIPSIFSSRSDSLSLSPKAKHAKDHTNTRENNQNPILRLVSKSRLLSTTSKMTTSQKCLTHRAT